MTEHMNVKIKMGELEFQFGSLVKVGGARYNYMNGDKLIRLAREMGELVFTLTCQRDSLLKERDRAREERDKLDQERGRWTGNKCKTCNGYGYARNQEGEEVKCQSCAGTGDEWLSWKESVESSDRLVVGDMSLLLREVLDKGLIYWEPITERGHIAKADMIKRCEAALSAEAPTIPPPAAMPADGWVQEAKVHIVSLEQCCSTFVESAPLRRAMTEVATFIRSMLAARPNPPAGGDA